MSCAVKSLETSTLMYRSETSEPGRALRPRCEASDREQASSF